ncbi:thioredoxin peroxidase [Saccharomycopsis crataegensis]|uniref:Thioredoxin peroxidase n=1 Tax=Saccharomycopsis crataegensis TaxID=43959 RepID=A0AAV5QDU6_9ASCO|nr:thioredoxin peroxidase [Saccharomycopsis crataegensis]
MSLKQGDAVPANTIFKYVPVKLNDTDSLTCPAPVAYNLSKDAEQSKKVLIVSYPGAFTPTCSQTHVPEFLEDANIKTVLAKGYDKIVFLSANDPFVLQAFAKALGVDKDETKVKHVIFASDTYAEFSKKFGLELDLTKMGLGIRTGRYAMVINDGKVSYIGQELGGDVTVSGFKSVLQHL